jgi:hypothetical protein
MKREDEVLCTTCGRAFPIGLVEMVRLRHPLWCSECIAHADSRLSEVATRASRIGEVLGER